MQLQAALADVWEAFGALGVEELGEVSPLGERVAEQVLPPPSPIHPTGHILSHPLKYLSAPLTSAPLSCWHPVLHPATITSRYLLRPILWVVNAEFLQTAFEGC